MKTPQVITRILQVLRGLALALAVFALVQPGAHAATRIKQDNTTALNLAGSWDVLPGLADIAQWDATVTGANSTVLGANLNWLGLKIISPAGLVTLGAGNTLTLGASGIDLSAATADLTLNCGLTLQGRQSWKAVTGRTLSVAGAFTHTGALVDFSSFSGTAALSGVANDASGMLGPWATTGANATFNYVQNTAGAISAFTAQTAATPGTLANVTDPTVNYSFSFASAGAGLTGPISANTLLYTGGDYTLANNGYSITLNGLIFPGGGWGPYFGTAGGGNLVIGASKELVIAASGRNPRIYTPIVDNPGGPSSVTLYTTGELQLNATVASTYSGGTTVSGTGQVDVNNSGSLGSGPVTVNAGVTLQRSAALTNSLTMNGGTITFPNWDQMNAPVTLGSGTSTFSVGTGNNYINVNMSGAGGLNKAGNANLYLSGANTYTGPTTISSANGSRLEVVRPEGLYNGNTASWSPTNLTVASGGVLAVSIGGGTNFTTDQIGVLLGSLTTGLNNNGLKAGSYFGFDTQNGGVSGTTTYAGTITDSTGTGGGAVGIQKINQGTLILAGANTYTGPTTLASDSSSANWLKAGVASVPNVSGAFGNNSAVTLLNYAGGLDLNGWDTQIGSLTGGGTSGGNVVLGANTLTIGGNNTSPAAYAGVISDGGSSGNLTKIGSGTLMLTGKNTYYGTTTINGGTVNLGITESASPAYGPLGINGLIVLGGGTLQYSSVNNYDYSWRFSTAPGQACNVDTANRPVTWATALTSSGGSVLKTGLNTLTLSGANSYSGATTVNGGTLKAGVASVPGVSGAFGNNSAVTLANTAGVTLDLTGYSTQIGSLTGGGALGGTVTNTSATLTIGGDNTSPAAFAGVIAGSGGSLVKIGTGTLTLNNTDTYTGSTIIQGGTLALGSSGSISGASPLIALAAGATFDVSAKASPYVLGSSSALSAGGTDLTTGAATLKGPAAISLNARPLALTLTPTSAFGDRAHPALVIAQGDLDATGVVITLTNNGTALNATTFTLITNVNGTITGTPSLAGNTVYGNGLVSGRNASISLSSDAKAVNLLVSAVAVPVTVTLTRHPLGAPTTSTYGDVLQFDVTVTTATNGTVTLCDGGPLGAPIGSATLTGSTTCTIAAARNGLTAGTHANIVAVFAGSGYASTNSAALTPAQVVGPAGLTVTSAVGDNKLYDGTAAATLTGTLSGLIPGDTDIEVNLIGTGTFDNGGAVGTTLAITSTSTLGGTKASSYSLTQPAGVTADILNTAVWTSLTSGVNWSSAGNWTNGLVGTGADVTADFSTLDLTGDLTAHLDSPRTIGSLTFGDTTTSSAGSWTVDNNGDALNVLTLAGSNTVPTITVNTLGTWKAVTLSSELSLATNVIVNVVPANAVNGTLNLSGLISGAGGLTKNGSGTLNVLNLANTYSGGTIINSGTLLLATLGGGGLGSGPVTLNDNATLGLPNSPAIANALTVNGGTITTGYGSTWAGPVTLNVNQTFNVPNYMGFAGSISGAGGFTKTGGGQLTLSVANSYTGGTIVQAGILLCNNQGALGGGALSISNGATVNLNYSGDHAVPSLTIAGTSMPLGTYGSTASGATSPDDTHFTGSGTVTVVGSILPPVLDPTGFSALGGVPMFTFATASGSRYRMVYTDNVANAITAWLPVVNEPSTDAEGWVPGTGSSVSITDPTNTSGAQQRFYRLEQATP